MDETFYEFLTLRAIAMTLQTYFLVGLGALVLCSVIEHLIHRFPMHNKRISEWAHKRHAIQHHSERRSLRNFFSPSGKPEEYKFLASSAAPRITLAFIPLGVLLWTYISPVVSVIVVSIFTMYTVMYEVIHYFIHNPRECLLTKSRFWGFYYEYHRIHHHRATVNFNVVCPIGDLILGKICLMSLKPEPSRPSYMPAFTGPLSVFQRKPPTSGSQTS